MRGRSLLTVSPNGPRILGLPAPDQYSIKTSITPRFPAPTSETIVPEYGIIGVAVTR